MSFGMFKSGDIIQISLPEDVDKDVFPPLNNFIIEHSASKAAISQ